MDRLRDLRVSKKLTQSAVANALNTSRQAYNFYENGNREPNTEMLQRMADFYNVSVDYLIGRTNNPRPIENIDIPQDLLLELKNADEKMIQDVWKYINFLHYQEKMKK